MGPKGSEPEGGGYSGFVKGFESLQIVIPPRGPRGSLWPLWELFNNVAAESNRLMDGWVGPLVKQALDTKIKRGSEKLDYEEGSLLDHIAEATDDVQVIRDEVSSGSNSVQRSLRAQYCNC